MKNRNKIRHRTLKIQEEDIEMENSVKIQMTELSQQITLLNNNSKGRDKWLHNLLFLGYSLSDFLKILKPFIMTLITSEKVSLILRILTLTTWQDYNNNQKAIRDFAEFKKVNLNDYNNNDNLNTCSVWLRTFIEFNLFKSLCSLGESDVSCKLNFFD